MQHNEIIQKKDGSQYILATLKIVFKGLLSNQTVFLTQVGLLPEM